MKKKHIHVIGAKEHNLKDVEICIPRDSFVVVTGVSGSGKSSLCFDTIFAEGQRKYLESLSAYARQFLDQMKKPNVGHISGLPPTIAIEQHGRAHNPRSTVATTTEVYDYLRLLFARVGTPHCWKKGCGLPIARQEARDIVDNLFAIGKGDAVTILAPLVTGKKGFHKDVCAAALKNGMSALLVNDEAVDLADVDMSGENPLKLGRYEQHSIQAVVTKLKVDQKNRQDIIAACETALEIGHGSLVAEIGKKIERYSTMLACPEHADCSLPELTPRTFSFNSPFGACPSCSGLGTSSEFDLERICDVSVAIGQGCFCIFDKMGFFYERFYRRLLQKFCKTNGIDKNTPYQNLSKSDQECVFTRVCELLQKRLQETDSDRVRELLFEHLSSKPCSLCCGARLKKSALAVTIGKCNIAEIAAMTVANARSFFEGLTLTGNAKLIAEPILNEIRARLGFLESVGLGYVGLNRHTSTLSGGEAQRIRLASQVGTGLVGVCYVLDEPTIGLHPRDNVRLIETLRRLVDIGNTAIVVEHDEEMMLSCDYLLDMGPGAGKHGGTVVAAGTVEQVMKNSQSLTGQYLQKIKSIPIPAKRRHLHGQIWVRNASENNLKNIDVCFPLGGIVCVTGVSGSGKSTLVNDVLLKQLSGEKGEHISRIIAVDQSPIGKTSRSNPATYTGLFDDIRALFSKSSQAAAKGYGPGRFSFNVKGGRCEHCQGQGSLQIEMHFLADVNVVCEKCQGTRYNEQTLDVLFNGKNIADVLQMTVEEAALFFCDFPKLRRTLECLKSVGLTYMQLGQASTLLSGGEAQRVKLASELCRVYGEQKTLYVLDEPTTGLHFVDIEKLLTVFHALADRGHSLVIIEHNTDVMKNADWIIDLGPEGGEGGGRIVAEGTPEEIASCAQSLTGQFLQKQLENIETLR